MTNFKPMLAPNNSVDGSKIDWVKRIKVPNQWFVSEKLDGVRAEIFFSEDGSVKIKTRALKQFKSKWISDLEKKLEGKYPYNAVLEGEIYAPGLTRNEIIHFTNSFNITDEKSKKKYYNLWVKSNRGEKIKPNGDSIWPYPGRDLTWVTNYPSDLSINLFDIYCYNDIMFKQRLKCLNRFYDKIGINIKEIDFIPQFEMTSVVEIENWYEKLVDNGSEGVILKRQDNRYKLNRVTLNECTMFKMKDELNFYHGTIIDVVEGDQVIEGIPTEYNELGRSVTSKLKEDREPNGRAKGLLVKCGYGELILTLKGFNNIEKTYMLNNKKEWIGKNIQFIAMKPGKIGGVPLQAKYVKTNKDE